MNIYRLYTLKNGVRGRATGVTVEAATYDDAYTLLENVSGMDMTNYCVVFDRVDHVAPSIERNKQLMADWAERHCVATYPLVA